MNTSWTEFLQSRQASFNPDNSSEVSFTSARSEAALAATGSILSPLTHLGLIQASGEDACNFLHNLGSNDIKKLAENRAQHNSLNSPKGRMLANFLVWRSENSYMLMLSAELQAAIQKKLSMYVLRAKVSIIDATESRCLLGLAGPQAEAALAATGLVSPAQLLDVCQGNIRVISLDDKRYILDAPAAEASELWDRLVAAGLEPAGTAAWRWLDIQAGQPVINAQSQDEFIAQMLNFELIGGVNFQKGCYPGQEIVARTQYLGKLKKRMFRAHCQTEAPVCTGMDLYAPEFAGQSCGKVLSVTPAPEQGFDLLAVLQISAFEAAEVHLGAPDGPRLSFLPLPYTID